MSSLFPQQLDSFTNPSGSTILDSTNPNLKHSVQHQNINDAMSAVQAHIGISGSDVVETVNYRIKKLQEDVKTISSGTVIDFKKIQFLYNGPFEIFEDLQYIKEINYNGYFVNNIVWYADVNKTKKLFEIQYLDRNSKKQATRITYTVYHSDGNSIKSNVEDIITYNGPLETNRTRTVL